MWCCQQASHAHPGCELLTHVLDVSCHGCELLTHTLEVSCSHTRPGSLIPRPSLPPVFDCLQYMQKRILQAIKYWKEWGYTVLTQTLDVCYALCIHWTTNTIIKFLPGKSDLNFFFSCSFFLEPGRQVCCGHPLHNQVILHFTVIYAGNIWLLRTFSSQWMNSPPLVLTLYPSCLHTTLVSVLSQPPPHTVPHAPLMQTSTVPALSRGPLTNRSAPLVQFWTAVYRE